MSRAVGRNKSYRIDQALAPAPDRLSTGGAEDSRFPEPSTVFFPSSTVRPTKEAANVFVYIPRGPVCVGSKKSQMTGVYRHLWFDCFMITGSIRSWTLKVRQFSTPHFELLVAPQAPKRGASQGSGVCCRGAWTPALAKRAWLLALAGATLTRAASAERTAGAAAT